MENLAICLLRKPDNVAFAKALLANTMNPELSSAVKALAQANHSHFNGSELEAVYVARATAGINFLLNNFSRGTFDFRIFEQFVDITAYSKDSATRRDDDSYNPYYVAEDVICVINSIRQHLQLPLPSDDYLINLPAVSEPVEVSSFGGSVTEVRILPSKYAAEFEAIIVEQVNTVLVANSEQLVGKAALVLQLLMHKWHTIGGVASRAINFFNAILIHKGLNPVPHGIYDYAALLMQPEEFARYVVESVSSFN